HFIEVFEQADVDGALAATVFHNNKVPIPALKEMLSAAGIGVRL
ncbi:MAG: imidazole glycerol phosphate synthase subunit HisF, partial [Xanthomonadales bacterium]|nr:imidazole glycerol phosphate synthase subunit HisF [Xanthomonadales bacterium]